MYLLNQRILNIQIPTEMDQYTSREMLRERIKFSKIVEGLENF